MPMEESKTLEMASEPKEFFFFVTQDCTINSCFNKHFLINQNENPSKHLAVVKFQGNMNVNEKYRNGSFVVFEYELKLCPAMVIL